MKQIFQDFKAFLNNLKSFKLSPQYTEQTIVSAVQQLSLFSADQLQNYFIQIVKRKDKCRGKAKSWVEKELKLFLWIVSKTAEFLQKEADEFTQENWQKISNFFPDKDPHTCLYFWKLSTNKLPAYNYQQQQDQMLQQIIAENAEKSQKIKWNQVARKMYQLSKQKYMKKPKQYRQRWINYLNPNIKRNQWNRQEDQKLIKLLLKNGKKWSLIGKQLFRTENSVKNRFRSLVIKKLAKSESSKKRFWESKNILRLASHLSQTLEKALAEDQIEKTDQRQKQQIVHPHPSVKELLDSKVKFSIEPVETYGGVTPVSCLSSTLTLVISPFSMNTLPMFADFFLTPGYPTQLVKIQNNEDKFAQN